MYSVIDILNKAIAQSKHRKDIMNRHWEKASNIRTKILISVIIKGIDRDIDFYEEVINDIDKAEVEKITIDVYDKIASLMNQFTVNLRVLEEIDLDGDIIGQCMELNSSLLALFINIQGRLAESGAETFQKSYDILSKIMEDKRRLLITAENLRK